MGVIAEAGRGQAEPEMGVVVAGTLGDDRGEVLASPAERAGTVLRPGQCLPDRAGRRLRPVRVLEECRGRCGVAGGEQLKTPDVPVVDRTGGSHGLLVSHCLLTS